MKALGIIDHYIRFERRLPNEKTFFLYHPRKGSLSWRFGPLMLDLEYC